MALEPEVVIEDGRIQFLGDDLPMPKAQPSQFEFNDDEVPIHHPSLHLCLFDSYSC